ncbi:hypothetical protein LDENG_00081780 [Lucifuga dentata]|nr:hypothetical protein LDENG_00081780 [Lucifuga dentata]
MSPGRIKPANVSNSLDGSFPPSPAEDRGLKRLSWGILVQKLAEVKRVHRRLSHQRCSGTQTDSMLETSLSDSDSSVFCYPLEETLAAEIVETIAQSLKDTSDTLDCCRLILPDSLLHNISRELLHLSASEPCGLRGALIDLCVDQQDSLCTVDQIAVDASLVPTFHVTLVLRSEVSGLWLKVQRLFKGSKSPQIQATSARHQHTLRLSSSFRAMKRKLYSSEELLIEDC